MMNAFMEKHGIWNMKVKVKDGEDQELVIMFILKSQTYETRKGTKKRLRT